MFHWAPPEVNGLGVMTSTSSLTRSSQVWMFFGVALADREHDDRVGDEAVVLVLLPVRVDEAGVDEAVDVRLQRERDDVGVRPASTARVWSPDGP